MGGSEDFGVRTGSLIRPLDSPVLHWSRRFLGTLATANLGQKPKLGGVRALLTFPLYYPFHYFDLFEVFACFSFFLSFFAKTTKIFSLFFCFLFTFEKPKKISFLSLVCFVFRGQLESVMAFDYIFPTFGRASDKAVMTKIDERDATRRTGMNSFVSTFVHMLVLMN